MYRGDFRQYSTPCHPSFSVRVPVSSLVCVIFFFFTAEPSRSVSRFPWRMSKDLPRDEQAEWTSDKSGLLRRKSDVCQVAHPQLLALGHSSSRVPADVLYVTQPPHENSPGTGAGELGCSRLVFIPCCLNSPATKARGLGHVPVASVFRQKPDDVSIVWARSDVCRLKLQVGKTLPFYLQGNATSASTGFTRRTAKHIPKYHRTCIMF